MSAIIPTNDGVHGMCAGFAGRLSVACVGSQEMPLSLSTAVSVPKSVMFDAIVV